MYGYGYGYVCLRTSSPRHGESVAFDGHTAWDVRWGFLNSALCLVVEVGGVLGRVELLLVNSVRENKYDMGCVCNYGEVCGCEWVLMWDGELDSRYQA